ncbi:VOC family protein [Legionella gresilensis]|uniref:VOC family protein n=1 Tax=Legionella gresilensis TaxID=91823 RepID=UPI00104143F4|nr:VOC family protein [Legionella gresilensis]
MFPKHLGLRHIALRVNNLKQCIDFYQRIIGMKLELQTENYAYFTSGKDNISLHEKGAINFHPEQRLEHFGFACESPEQVDQWYEHCKSYHVDLQSPPETFGIGTKSFSVFDPSGNEIEFIYHSPMVR